MDLAHDTRPPRSDLRSWLSTRQGTIVVAVVCAVIAAGIIIFAMHQYRQSVDAKGKPETVFVANGVIQKGTSGDAIASERLFTPTRLVTKQVSAGAVADASVLHGKVAATTIYPGQQLTTSDFVVGGGLAGQLAPNQRAISLPLDASHGMVGQIAPGDHVDVYAGWYATGQGQQHGTGLLRLLIPNVLVLGVSNSGAGGIGGPGNGGTTLFTLQVDDSQAGQVAYAADQAQVWLTLRPGNASTPSPAVVTANSILAGTPSPPTSGGPK
jgi:Flp pilus assembly protein CpaB